ncbi:phosphatase PAP2 family protein [candidate division KSB1 bacterium]|nr:phosphatase PAP2 family protein [candidate division KSB1 bacterium]
MENRQPDYRFFCLGVFVLIAGTIVFRANGGALDIAITNFFYNADLMPGNRFFLARLQPWDWFKKNDSTFAIVLIFPLAFMLVLGLIRSSFRGLVRYASFGLSSVLIGPGLVVNVLFKGFWGRPRPSQTLIFADSLTPDELPFYKVWQPAFLDGLDKASFPCGHASIVIAYIVIAYIFINPQISSRLFGEFRPWKLKLFIGLKYFGLVLAFAGGFVMGLTRIVQGAHFASDVLWSFGMVLLVNWIVYYFVFKIPQWEMKIMTQTADMTA